jgi:hypothetical protein
LPAGRREMEVECQQQPPIESTQEVLVSAQTEESVEYPGAPHIPTVEIPIVPSQNINNNITENITMSDFSILTPQETLMDGSTVYKIATTQDTNLPQASMIPSSLVPDTQIVANLDNSQIPTQSGLAQPTVEYQRDIVNNSLLTTVTDETVVTAVNNKDIGTNTTPNTEKEATDDEEEDMDDDLINSHISECVIPVGDNTPIQNNIIKVRKPGTQVCVYEYDILPPVGKLFKIDENHNFVQVTYKPGQVYQADQYGNLHCLYRM